MSMEPQRGSSPRVPYFAFGFFKVISGNLYQFK